MYIESNNSSDKHVNSPLAGRRLISLVDQFRIWIGYIGEYGGLTTRRLANKLTTHFRAHGKTVIGQFPGGERSDSINLRTIQQNVAGTGLCTYGIALFGNMMIWLREQWETTTAHEITTLEGTRNAFKDSALLKQAEEGNRLQVDELQKGVAQAKQLLEDAAKASGCTTDIVVKVKHLEFAFDQVVSPNEVEATLKAKANRMREVYRNFDLRGITPGSAFKTATAFPDGGGIVKSYIKREDLNRDEAIYNEEHPLVIQHGSAQDLGVLPVLQEDAIRHASNLSIDHPKIEQLSYEIALRRLIQHCPSGQLDKILLLLVQSSGQIRVHSSDRGLYEAVNRLEAAKILERVPVWQATFQLRPQYGALLDQHSMIVNLLNH